MFSDEQKTFITKFGLNGTFFAFFVDGLGSLYSGSGAMMCNICYMYLKIYYLCQFNKLHLLFSAVDTLLV